MIYIFALIFYVNDTFLGEKKFYQKGETHDVKETQLGPD
jgi:hypothetical protein